METRDHFQKKIDQFLQTGNRILLGKEKNLKLSLCCLLADGHLLLEDIPGVGKTTLVHFLGKIFGLHFGRIQFTNDLLPSDILGVSIFDQDKKGFVFHPGPIFGQLILADELNRATPKTQSALLEVMEERKVTIEGKIHLMEEPFMVVATQNPQEHIGTFPLPESQLDRFLMSMELGYPDKAAEMQLLREGPRRKMVEDLSPLFVPQDIFTLRKMVGDVTVSPAIFEYVCEILRTGRLKNYGRLGLSPRAGLGLVQAARAWAFLERRDFVIPEDIQAVAVYVFAHRLGLDRSSLHHEGREMALKILETVEVE